MASSLSTLSVARSRATLAGLDESLVGEKKDTSVPELIELSDGIKVSVSSSPSPLFEDENASKSQPVVKIEKVVNAWGSAAGAGSDFFDKYRVTRNAEMKRLEQMEADWKKKVEAEEFHLQRHRRIVETQEKNKAARERRRRRKMKKKSGQRAPAESKTPEGEAAGDDSDEEEESGGGLETAERARKRPRKEDDEGEAEEVTTPTRRDDETQKAKTPADAASAHASRGEEDAKKRKADVESPFEQQANATDATQTENAVERMRPGMLIVKDDEW
ncbi:hypothetical protein BESB_053780 [Besnoitia besnoiti]|uniref:Uncharacterized protein n=1 Tax=Besnoitia besnoiti TaxID=94643 RepID=A0A2A9MJF2_BESBE|nr:hypothetical protein BESB_053780 [Besnoitia besnoiti]PFH35727.1 hypothetical protein BESB_053780 [Besnoitia besnoiti]